MSLVGESTDVIINLMTAVVVHAVSLSQIIRTLENNRTIVDVISNTFAFPAVTSQHFCCGKALLLPMCETASSAMLYRWQIKTHLNSG